MSGSTLIMNGNYKCSYDNGTNPCTSCLKKIYVFPHEYFQTVFSFPYVFIIVTHIHMCVKSGV